MTEPVVKRGRTRRTHSEHFKQHLINQCLPPGVSLANIARQHGLHPNLLSRWVKERTEPAAMTVSPQPSMVPQFVPIDVQSAQNVELVRSGGSFNTIEVNIDRADLHIAFKVDSSQMSELGQMLREVLR